MFETLNDIWSLLKQSGQTAMPQTPATPPTPATSVEPTTNSGPLAGLGGVLGLNDGTAGPTAFGGLLNFKDEESKQAALRGMLGASASLMAAGAPSDKPTSFLGNLGGAVANGVGAYDGYKDGQADRAYKAAQTARYGVANAQDAYKIQQEQKAAAARAALFGGAGFNGGSNTGATSVPTTASGSPASVASPSPAAPNSGTDLATQINTQRATLERQYNGLMAIGDTTAANPIFAQKNFLDNEAAKQGLVWDGSKYTAAPGFNEGAQALKQAEATGTSLGNRNAWTEDQKERAAVNQERAAKGLPAIGLEEYTLSQKRAGATTVNVNDGNKYGTIPPGYRLVEGPNGAYMEAIPGSPDAVKADQAASAKDSKAAHANVSSDAVDTAFNNVLRVDSNATLPTTGFFGGLLSNVGGTGANDMRAALETLKANASLSTLQKMRDESPTGAGMGSPSDSEQKMIQAAYATLEQSQSRNEFIRNLNNFRNLWMDLVHGEGNGPERYPVTYGLNPLTAEEQAQTGASTNNAGGSLPTIKGAEDFYKLAPGTVYIDPQGNKRTKQ